MPGLFRPHGSRCPASPAGPGACASVSMENTQPSSTASREQPVRRVLALGPAVDLDRRPALPARARTPRPASNSDSGRARGPPVADQPAGAVPEDVDVRVARPRPASAPVIGAAGHPQLGVHAGHHHVEPGEQVVALVERAVLEDVHLDAGQDAERRQLLVQLADQRRAGRSSRSADSPLATVSRGEWSVSAIHSCPRSRAASAISPRRAAAVGPVRVRVAVAAQRRPQLVRRATAAAPRAAWPGSAGTSPRAACSRPRRWSSPMPLRACSVPASIRCSSSPGGQDVEHGGGPAERLHTVGRRPGALQLERDLPQRINWIHAGLLPRPRQN